MTDTTEGGATPPVDKEVIAATPAPAGESKTPPDAGDAKTLLDGAAPPPKEPVKTLFPDDWRETYAKGDEKKLNRLKKFTSPFDGLDSFFEADKLINSGKLKKPLPENATPEQLTEWRKANNIPEAPDKYELKMDDGLIIGERDKPLVDAWLAEAHGKNMDAATASSAINAYYRIQEQQRQAMLEADTDYQIENQQLLMQEFGGEYKRNLNAVKSLLASAPDGIGEILLEGRTGDGKVLGNDARVIRWLSGLARQVNPAATVVPSGTEGGVTDGIAEIEAIRRNDPDKYWNDKAMQTRYGALIEAQQAIKARG